MVPMPGCSPWFAVVIFVFYGFLGFPWFSLEKMSPTNLQKIVQTSAKKLLKISPSQKSPKYRKNLPKIFQLSRNNLPKNLPNISREYPKMIPKTFQKSSKHIPKIFQQIRKIGFAHAGTTTR